MWKCVFDVPKLKRYLKMMTILMWMLRDLKSTSGQDNRESEQQVFWKVSEYPCWFSDCLSYFCSDGVNSLGVSLTRTDEDEDLVVDGDDTQMYGSPQYSEHDVVIPGDDKEQVALRKVILGGTGQQDAGKDISAVNGDIGNGDPIVEALKNRIRELESRERKNEVYKCLICMDRYQTPVISICCWHVHCEQCWLQTLGAKKLCPQCNMITSPADLRRIYM